MSGGTITHATAQAMLDRAITGLLIAAATNQPARANFWRGGIKALRSLLDCDGPALAARKDEASGAYQPPAHLQAAWTALPHDVERLSLVEVQQLLAAQGVEIASDFVAHGQINRIEELEECEVSPFGLDDEQATHVVNVDDGSEHGRAFGAEPIVAKKWVLRFTEWQCGHHWQRPDDIPVADPIQASLILQAISHAISQPGHARAVLMDDAQGQDAYITDDYLSVGYGGRSEFSADGRGWSFRPEVICCTPEQQAEIHSVALKDALESLHGGIDCWDGQAEAGSGRILTTTLSRQEVEALAAPLDAYEERRMLFELPPVFLDAGEALEGLRKEAAYLASEEGSMA